jgi:adenosylhomocysteine nucleosidase
MRFLFLVVVVLITAAGAGLQSTATEEEAITAVLGAFDAEVDIIHEEMTSKRDTAYLGVTFTMGTLRGRRVVLAHTGYGKVNAAMTATLLIEHLRPREVIFTGIAGGLNPQLQPGDLVIGLQTAHHDYGYVKDDTTENVGTWNRVTGIRNPLFLPADSMLVETAREAGAVISLDSIPMNGGGRQPRLLEGTIVTGDAFIASASKKRELRRSLGADAVEMEGAAVAQICMQTETPCLIVRSISDRADSTAVQDAELFYRIAAKNSAVLVMKIVELLARGPDPE